MRVAPRAQHRRTVSPTWLLRTKRPRASHGDRAPRAWRRCDHPVGGAHAQVRMVEGGRGRLPRRSRHRRGLAAGDLEQFAQHPRTAGIGRCCRKRFDYGAASSAVPTPCHLRAEPVAAPSCAAAKLGACDSLSPTCNMQHLSRCRPPTFGHDRASVSNAHSRFTGGRARLSKDAPVSEAQLALRAPCRGRRRPSGGCALRSESPRRRRASGRSARPAGQVGNAAASANR